MFKRVLLGILFLASLAWIAYYAWHIASAKNNYVPEIVFSESDGQLLVVLRSDEVNFNAIESFQEAPTLDLIKSLNDSSYQKGYFSQKRAHLLLFSEVNWNSQSIKKLFDDKSVKIDGSEVSVAGYSGKFYKNSLYLSKGNLLHEGDESTHFLIDKKASASLITFADKGIKNTTDIYFKANGRVNFVTRNANIEQGTQIKDENIFAGLVSRNISNYHFYERDYYATLDQEFATGPMHQWLLNGFAVADYDGETVIVSDYLGGQDPILILNDINQTLDSNRFENRLTKDFPSQGGSYVVKYLEDLVVFSESESACDKMLADYKLGITIASSTNVRYRYFGELPKAVSERFVGEDQSFSKSVYQGRLMETYTGIPVPEASKELSASVNLSCGFDIKDFVVLPGQGNLAVLGTQGEIACYTNKKLAWKKKIDDKIVGTISLIDLHYNGEMYVHLNTGNQLYLWDLKGKDATGFPVNIESEITAPTKFYRWRERSYFLVGTENNKLIQFDAKGRELDVYKVDHPIQKPIDIWVSQKRLFAGLASNTVQFTMFELEKRRSLRSFEILPGSKSVKVPNQLYRFSITDNALVRMDQKGRQDNIDRYPEGKLLYISKNVMAIQTGNTLSLLNEEGIGFGQITVPFSDVGDLYITTLESDKTYICVIDALENNVYLYGTDGSQLSNKALEGQTRVHLQTVGNSKCITTVVDQFVIQYIED
ncbi:hypothetical protein OAK35_02610 [Crocinitomicaceae bacterium]|nr:hypothetical protein [Crocinitomicaceae bacterium]MDC0257614.1 hypothetical protein [Crocinitomicaceae bacterium]